MAQSAEEIRAAVNAVADEERRKFAPGTAESDYEPEAEPILSEDILRELNRNADGDASLFIRLHKGHLVYDCAYGQWFRFDENHFVEDLTGEALQGVNAVVDVYEVEARRQSWLRAKAARESNSEAGTLHRRNETALLKRIKMLQRLQRKKEILDLARSGAGTLAITGTEWDLDTSLLAVKNGVVNLMTGTLRAGDPGDFIKTAAPTEWQGLHEPCPAWEHFLSDIFGGDEKLVSFIQRLLGYGITGLSIHHIFIILWGLGRNGKGTVLEILRSVLGDFTLKTESELLLEQKYARQAGAPNSGILSLRGRRIVWASETSDGRRLNAGKLKELVGGDTLNARPIFGKHHIQFKPTHLLLLLTNSKPVAPASDYALWQRVLLIPFERAFVDNPKAPNESKADLYLVDKLKAEAPGILAWLVRGCLVWQREGLNPPDIVKAATKDYQNDEDTLAPFILERCVLGESCHVRAGEFYKSWKSWAEENGATYLSNTRFGKEIKRRGFKGDSDNRGNYYMGIGLIGEG